MKKTISLLSLVLLLLSASPPPVKRVTKEYSSIAELAWDLDKGQLLNLPTFELKTVYYPDVGDIQLLVPIMKKTLIDIVVHDDIYGDMQIVDDELRYILTASRYYNFEPIYIFSLLQASGLEYINRYSIQKRLSWAYRIRALGTPEKYILSKYLELDKEFFK